MHRLLGQTARLNEACGRPSRGLGNSPAAVKVSADYRLARSQDAAHKGANRASRCKAAVCDGLVGELLTLRALAPSQWDFINLDAVFSSPPLISIVSGVLHG